jgi:hypothetical protein
MPASSVRRSRRLSANLPSAQYDLTRAFAGCLPFTRDRLKRFRGYSHSRLLNSGEHLSALRIARYPGSGNERKAAPWDRLRHGHAARPQGQAGQPEHPSILGDELRRLQREQEPKVTFRVHIRARVTVHDRGRRANA